MNKPPLIIQNSKNKKVYKNNNLNRANFHNFNHTDYQVFLHLVSKIGGVTEQGDYIQHIDLQRQHTLTAREYSDLFNCDIANSYKFLKNSLEKLMKTDIKVLKNNNTELWCINVCSQAMYNQSQGSITIEFTDSIMPYLAQVKEKFVLYNLKEISNFKSIYTTRLYEIIQEFKDTGYMIKSVDQLRESFASGNKYKSYKDFKRATFCRGCHEINRNYDMNISYQEIKEGRKVVAVKFTFKKTQLHKVINQKTGKSRNLYKKPKQKIVQKKIKKNQSTLDGQMSFSDNKNEEKGLLKNILKKFF